MWKFQTDVRIWFYLSKDFNIKVLFELFLLNKNKQKKHRIKHSLQATRPAPNNIFDRIPPHCDVGQMNDFYWENCDLQPCRLSDLIHGILVLTLDNILMMIERQTTFYYYLTELFLLPCVRM